MCSGRLRITQVVLTIAACLCFNQLLVSMNKIRLSKQQLLRRTVEFAKEMQIGNNDFDSNVGTIQSERSYSNTFGELEKPINTEAYKYAQISPACRPRFLNGRKINRIFFLHMRKAGGTTLRSYLYRVAQEYNLTYRSAEGRNTVEMPMDDNTLYVTNLREPVARAISHYKYDQRWDCQQLIKNTSFIPSYNNTRGSLLDFVNQVGKQTPGLLMDCGSNCYTRWASGKYHEGDPCSIGKNDTRLELALDSLLKNHLIIITEKLPQFSYARGIENFFGVRGLVGSQSIMFCGAESASANYEFPLIVSDSTRKQVADCNVADRILYTELTTCPDGIEIPKFNRSYFA